MHWNRKRRPPPPPPTHQQADREAEVDELVDTVEANLAQLQSTVAEMARRLRADPRNGSESHA